MDEGKWNIMRVALMGKTVKELKAICKEEGICPGWDASRKDSLVGCIVANRRNRDLQARS